MPRGSKKIIRIITICLITALFAGVVLSSQTKVVQAADAFLKVQEIRDSIDSDNGKKFQILEIVDSKSSFPSIVDENNNIIQIILDIAKFPLCGKSRKEITDFLCISRGLCFGDGR